MGTKGKKNLWKKWLITLGILVVVCCAGLLFLVNSIPTYERHRPLLDLQDSYLLTPRGLIPFEFSNRSAHYPTDENSAGKNIIVRKPAHKNIPKFALIFAIFNMSGKSTNASAFLSRGAYLPGSISAFNPDKIVIQPGAYYQLNQETKIHLTVTKNNTTQYHTNLNFNWPKPISEYNINMSGGTMYPGNVPIIKDGEKNSHYLFIPFAYGAEDFSIHLRFRLTVNTFESIGSWGP